MSSDFRPCFSEEEMSYLVHILGSLNDYIQGDTKTLNALSFYKDGATDRTKKMVRRMFGELKQSYLDRNRRKRPTKNVEIKQSDL